MAAVELGVGLRKFLPYMNEGTTEILSLNKENLLKTLFEKCLETEIYDTVEDILNTKVNKPIKAKSMNDAKKVILFKTLKFLKSKYPYSSPECFKITTDMSSRSKRVPLMAKQINEDYTQLHSKFRDDTLVCPDINYDVLFKEYMGQLNSIDVQNLKYLISSLNDEEKSKIIGNLSLSKDQDKSLNRLIIPDVALTRGGTKKKHKLEDYTVKELKEKAKKRNIKLQSKAKKADIIAVLRKK
jgi:hypothetical protein